jgi:hypothetical protein
VAGNKHAGLNMALIVKDRVQETTLTVGTGTLTLSGAVLGFQSFAAIGNGNTTYYAISDPITGDWEVGIGTYTASGTTLSRDTVLSSSTGASLVPFVAGIKNVFCTYPSERAVYLDSAGSYPVQNTFNTLNATTAVLTAGTVSTTPSAGNDIVNKTYVDTAVSSGIHFHTPVRVESPINLNATYNQPGGAGVGVGATLTNAGTQVALVIDGVTMVVNDRVLIFQQTTQTQNGIYVVTNIGSGSTNWVLTRSADADTYVAASANGLGEGSAVFVQQGTTGAGGTYVCNTPGTITFGTTNITFAQISSAQIYSAGTGLTLSGTQFSITNTAVTPTTYGTASSVGTFTVNAQGQLTNAVNTTIAIGAAAVSGLAASATTDTTNANNITSGSLGTSRLSGSYTGVTGVGTLTAGTWNASTIAAIYGGTGLTSFAAGDLIYANSSTTLARLADVAVGNALISGGVSADPSWGKIGLATHVDGTLPVANGGTGAATLAANNVLLGNGTSAVQTVAPGATGNVLVSNGTTWTSAAAGGGIPAGTAMLFVQTNAPTGWTKSTTHDNKALRVVSGAASSGGSVAFTTAFASQGVSGTNANTTATNQAQTAGGTVSTTLNVAGSVSATTLITSQIPSHTHAAGTAAGVAPGGKGSVSVRQTDAGGVQSGGAGGGGSHTHGFTNPTYSSSFTGTSHNHTQDAHTHTFTGTAINLAVQYVDVIVATKD